MLYLSALEMLHAETLYKSSYLYVYLFLSRKNEKRVLCVYFQMFEVSGGVHASEELPAASEERAPL